MRNNFTEFKLQKNSCDNLNYAILNQCQKISRSLKVLILSWFLLSDDVKDILEKPRSATASDGRIHSILLATSQLKNSNAVMFEPAIKKLPFLLTQIEA